MDKEFNPQGYNIGWNCCPVGGQLVMHAHMHVIPRFSQEPLAGTENGQNILQHSKLLGTTICFYLTSVNFVLSKPLRVCTDNFQGNPRLLLLPKRQTWH